jgi:hypothetical protein
MDRQRSHVDLHVRKQWEVRKYLLQFVIRLDVEDGEVRILADDAPEMRPFARALQLL